MFFSSSLFLFKHSVNLTYPFQICVCAHTRTHPLSPKPQCSSYWKGNLWVPLDYGRQLYLHTYIFFVHCNQWGPFDQVYDWRQDLWVHRWLMRLICMQKSLKQWEQEMVVAAAVADVAVPFLSFLCSWIAVSLLVSDFHSTCLCPAPDIPGKILLYIHTHTTCVYMCDVYAI